jgi:hypothetical protein
MSASEWSWLDKQFQPPPPLRYWARWDYTSEEWQRLDQLDWAPARRSMLMRALLPVGSLVLLGGVLASVVLGKLRADELLFPLLLGVLLALLFGSLLYFWLVLPPYRQARQRHLARKLGPQQIIIGAFSPDELHREHFLWQARLPIPLLQFIWLDFVSIELQQADLQLGGLPVVRLRRHLHQLTRRRRHWYRLEMDPASPPARIIGWSETLYLSVPFGHEAEAAALVQRFRYLTIPAAKICRQTAGK